MPCDCDLCSSSNFREWLEKYIAPNAEEGHPWGKPRTAKYMIDETAEFVHDHDPVLARDFDRVIRAYDRLEKAIARRLKRPKYGTTPVWHKENPQTQEPVPQADPSQGLNRELDVRGTKWRLYFDEAAQEWGAVCDELRLAASGKSMVELHMDCVEALNCIDPPPRVICIVCGMTVIDHLFGLCESCVGKLRKYVRDCNNCGYPTEDHHPLTGACLPYDHVTGQHIDTAAPPSVDSPAYTCKKCGGPMHPEDRMHSLSTCDACYEKEVFGPTEPPPIQDCEVHFQTRSASTGLAYFNTLQEACITQNRTKP